MVTSKSCAWALLLVACSGETVQVTGGVGNGPQLAVNDLTDAFNARMSSEYDVFMEAWPSGGSASQKALVCNVDCKTKFKGHSELCSNPPSQNCTSWGAAGLAFPDSWYDSYSDLDLELLPGGVGAICVAYSKDVTGNLGSYTDAKLNLSLGIVAGLLGGRITFWNDPSIQILNPSIVLPEEQVSVVVRSEKSSLNEELTLALNAAAPWWSQVPGFEEKAVGKKPQWPLANFSNPDDENYIMRDTQLDMAVAALRTYFSLTYLDCAEVERFEEFLGAAHLVNSAGRPVRPSPTSIQKALDSRLDQLTVSVSQTSSQMSSQPLAVSLVNPIDEEAYPLARMFYWYVKLATVANSVCFKAWLIKEMLLFWYNSELGRAIAANRGWTIPSASVVAIVEGRLGNMRCRDEHGLDMSIAEYLPPRQRQCPKGKFLEVLSHKSAVCQNCASGSYQPSAQSGFGTACLPSPSGAMVPETGQHGFLPCPPGTYQDESGQPRCKECPAGSYSPTTFMTRCFLCPEGTSTDGATGRPGCNPCSVSEFSAQEGAGRCERCPPQLTTSGRGSTSVERCGCPAGMHFSNSSGCRQCLTGVKCIGFGNPLQSLPGYVLSEDVQQGDSPPLVYKCWTPRFCPGGLPMTCTGGRTGAACSLCPAGHGAVDDACLPCDVSSGLTHSVLILFVATLISGIAFLVLGRASISKFTMRRCFLVSIAGCAAQVFQIWGVFALVPVTWPSQLSGFEEWASVFNLDLRSLVSTCASTPTDEYIFMSLLAIFCLMAVPASYGLTQLLPLPIKTEYTPDSALNFIGGMLYVSSIALVSVAARPFMCYEHPHGESSLTFAPSIVCGSREQRPLIVVGLALASLITAFFAVTVQAVWTAPLKAVGTDSASRSFRLKFQFLFLRAKPHRWYWACVALARSCALSLVNIVPAAPRVQLVMVVMTLVLFLCIQLHQLPLRFPIMNFVDVASTGFSLLGFIVAELANFEDGASDQHVLEVFCCTCMAAAALLVVGTGALSLLLASHSKTIKVPESLSALVVRGRVCKYTSLAKHAQRVSAKVVATKLETLDENIQKLYLDHASAISNGIDLLDCMLLHSDPGHSLAIPKGFAQGMHFDNATSVSEAISMSRSFQPISLSRFLKPWGERQHMHAVVPFDPSASAVPPEELH